MKRYFVLVRKAIVVKNTVNATKRVKNVMIDANAQIVLIMFIQYLI